MTECLSTGRLRVAPMKVVREGVSEQEDRNRTLYGTPFYMPFVSKIRQEVLIDCQVCRARPRGIFRPCSGLQKPVEMRHTEAAR